MAASQGVPAERIFEFGMKDNFWQMGDTGPCGPCSEIFYDFGVEASETGEDKPFGEDEQRYVEIWNLVFMQFDRASDGALTPLPKPSIDTGMGLERVAAVLQGVLSNFETDLFVPLIQRAAELTGSRFSGSAKGEDEGCGELRIIADHARAATFLISDGVVPANEGRGYVLRKILRRGIRHGRLLGQEKPFMHQMVFAVRDEMQVAYPELKETAERVSKVVLAEELQFARVMEVGSKELEKEIDEIHALHEEAEEILLGVESGNLQEFLQEGGGLRDYFLEGRNPADVARELLRQGKKFRGKAAFRLYETFGMPLDFMVDAARTPELRSTWRDLRRRRRRSRRGRGRVGRAGRRRQPRRYIASWRRRSLRATRRCAWMGRGFWRW